MDNLDSMRSGDTVVDIIVNPVAKSFQVQGAAMPVEALREGGEYVYVRDFPAHAKGQRYRMHRFVKDVPSYQRKCLVEALTGIDAGLWFVCSIANFCVRYVPAPTEDGECP